MQAKKLDERPNFPLLRQSDIQQFYHLQMPRWLFSDLRYCDMSLDAKVAYTFLLNRFQLSRRNNWINADGEVFVIFGRAEMQKELRVGKNRVSVAFQELAERNLIWERRCGQGALNQIYLAYVEPIEDPEYESAPFLSPSGFRVPETGNQESLKRGIKNPRNRESRIPKTGNLESLNQGIKNPRNRESRIPKTGNQESPKQGIKNPQSRESRIPETGNQESPKPGVTPIRDIYGVILTESVSQSRAGAREDGQTDSELQGILENCCLELFEPALRTVFTDAIERLYYTDGLRIGNALLPQDRVRSRLHLLNELMLQDVQRKMETNTTPIKNPTAYIMTVIYTTITEYESSVLVAPELHDTNGEE